MAATMTFINEHLVVLSNQHKDFRHGHFLFMQCQLNQRLTDGPTPFRDDQRNLFKGRLPGQAGLVGMTAADSPLLADTVLHRHQTGISWQDLPDNTSRRWSCRRPAAKCIG